MTRQAPAAPQAVIIMGVSGSGKTTVGQLLAESLNWTFHDADDFHSDQAKAEMARGQGLTDEERWPWLRRLRGVLDDAQMKGEGVVLACSALKRSYRALLEGPGTVFVYLRVPQAELEARLHHRDVTGSHYAGVSLLPSQLETLEEPTPDEPALTLTEEPGEGAGVQAAAAEEWVRAGALNQGQRR